MHTVCLQSIKHSGYKMGKDSLAVEQNNYTTKIVNAYTVYDLKAWPRYLTNNFKFKNCLFGATGIVKNNGKEKWVYSGYGIVFDEAYYGILVMTFLAMLQFMALIIFISVRWRRTSGINGKFGSLEKNIKFSKANTTFSFYVYGVNSYLFVNWKEIFQF